MNQDNEPNARIVEAAKNGLRVEPATQPGAEIFPCPFCGEANYLRIIQNDEDTFTIDVFTRVSTNVGGIYSVVCRNCGARGPEVVEPKSHPQVFDKWNTRQPDAAQGMLPKLVSGTSWEAKTSREHLHAMAVFNRWCAGMEATDTPINPETYSLELLNRNNNNL